MAKKAKESAAPAVEVRSSELAALADLKAHPRNYRKHPAAQLAHIAQSLRDFGFYRNVVVARDGTVLAGHGVVQASRKVGLAQVPVVRLDLDPLEPRALKLVALDNEVARLGEADDAALAALLKDVAAAGELLGTGHDDASLALLLGEQGGGGEPPPPRVTLAERFGVPPFSVLNAREGWWQGRKAAWIALGIRSELGRGEGVVPNGTARPPEQDGCYLRSRGANAAPGGSSRPLDRPAYAEQLKRTRPRAAPGGSPRPAAKVEGGKIRRGDGKGRPLPVPVDNSGGAP